MKDQPGNDMLIHPEKPVFIPFESIRGEGKRVVKIESLRNLHKGQYCIRRRKNFVDVVSFHKLRRFHIFKPESMSPSFFDFRKTEYSDIVLFLQMWRADQEVVVVFFMCLELFIEIHQHAECAAGFSSYAVYKDIHI